MSFRTMLFYKLGRWQDAAPFDWLYSLIEKVRYDWCWVDKDHKDDYL